MAWADHWKVQGGGGSTRDRVQCSVQMEKGAGKGAKGRENKSGSGFHTPPPLTASTTQPASASACAHHRTSSGHKGGPQKGQETAKRTTSPSPSRSASVVIFEVAGSTLCKSGPKLPSPDKREKSTISLTSSQSPCSHAEGASHPGEVGCRFCHQHQTWV